MKKLCNIACVVARVLFGLVFFVFGLNFFFHFLPMPPLNPEALAFMMALVNSGYIMTMVKVTELVAGAMILSGFCLPLGLVVITPIVINIVAFHTFLDTSGAPMAYFLLVCWAYLVWCYRASFKGLWAAKAHPTI